MGDAVAKADRYELGRLATMQMIHRLHHAPCGQVLGAAAPWLRGFWAEKTKDFGASHQLHRFTSCFCRLLNVG